MIARFEWQMKPATVTVSMIGLVVLLAVFGSLGPASAQDGADSRTPPAPSTIPTVPPRPSYAAPQDGQPGIPSTGDAKRPRPSYRWEDRPASATPEARPQDSFAIPRGEADFPAVPPSAKPVEAAPESTPDAAGPIFQVPDSTPSVPSQSGNYENPLDDVVIPAQEDVTDGVLPAPSESLREQLRDVLQERETVIRAQYIAGRASLSDLLFATDEVFRAELALRRQSDERVRLWKKYLENLQGFEAQIAPYATAGSGRVTRADYLAIKAIRLKTQIGLASEPLR